MEDVNYQSPVYLQLREIIRNKITEGVYPACTAIPSENELAEMYGINRQTVRKAIDILTEEGLLRKIQGKGVYVMKKMERNLDDLSGFTQTMVEKNMKPSFKVIKDVKRLAGEKYSELFGIKPSDEIYYIKRLCLADDQPISLEETYIPAYVVPKLNGIDLAVFSVYEVYEMYGVKLEHANQTLNLVKMEQNDARWLGLDNKQTVMLFESITYDDKGRNIEFNRNYVRGDKCNFNVQFSGGK